MGIAVSLDHQAELPKRSYFNGCSTGGREGLLLAQRYPDDFDGVIAGDPANFMGPLMGLYFTWLAKTSNDANGAPIITGAKLPALHQAVISACDGLDGLVDGQIDDPRACRFDPVAIQCPPGTDQPIPPAGTLDYHQRLCQHSGGLRATQQWARVFMVPTVYHCAAFAGGYRLNEFDPFPQLVAWVERGKAPDRIIANQRDAQRNVLRSRPVFPYPLRAAYDGTGSIDDASNFAPARPLVAPHDTIDWVGTDLYAMPGLVAR